VGNFDERQWGISVSAVSETATFAASTINSVKINAQSTRAIFTANTVGLSYSDYSSQFAVFDLVTGRAIGDNRTMA